MINEYKPADRPNVSPWIISNESKQLIEWLVKVFDGKEVEGTQYDENGKVSHAEVIIGDSVILLFDHANFKAGITCLRLYVPNLEETYHKALQENGTSITKPTHLFWGDLVARVKDSFSNIYWLNQKIEEVDEQLMAERTQDETFLKNMDYVTSAQIN